MIGSSFIDCMNGISLIDCVKGRRQFDYVNGSGQFVWIVGCSLFDCRNDRGQFDCVNGRRQFHHVNGRGSLIVWMVRAVCLIVWWNCQTNFKVQVRLALMSFKKACINISLIAIPLPSFLPKMFFHCPDTRFYSTLVNYSQMSILGSRSRYICCMYCHPWHVPLKPFYYFYTSLISLFCYFLFHIFYLICSSAVQLNFMNGEQGSIFDWELNTSLAAHGLCCCNFGYLIRKL